MANKRERQETYEAEKQEELHNQIIRKMIRRVWKPYQQEQQEDNRYISFEGGEK